MSLPFNHAMESCPVLRMLTILALTMGIGSLVVGQDKATVPLETYVLSPMTFSQTAFWIPVERAGPFIHHGSCSMAGKGRSHQCVFPQTTVLHSKSESCPNDLARLLAESVHAVADPKIPLMWLNGWQWTFMLPLLDELEVTYDLLPNGGSWENSWEQVMNTVHADVHGAWLTPQSSGHDETRSELQGQSHLSVFSYSDLQVRHGYPRQKKF